MVYEQTRYPFFKDYLKRERIGKDTDKIYEKCSTLFNTYLKDADFRNSEAIKIHVTTSILPLVAVYKVLQEEGLSSKEAYTHCLAISGIYANKKRESNKRFGKSRFGFMLFRMFCKKVMDRSFPSEGWKIEWKQKDKKGVAFDMHSCIYSEMTRAYGCPELCTVFCQNDVITFSGFEPAFYFKRKGTIAEGNPVCDFYFCKDE